MLSFLVTSQKPLQENKNANESWTLANADGAEIVNQRGTKNYGWAGTSLSTKPSLIKSKMGMARIKQRVPKVLNLV